MTSRIYIKYAKLHHFDWLNSKDQHIDEATLRKKIIDQQILIVTREETLIGWLRFGYFWDEIPFMNMLFLTKENRYKGIGKRLVGYWEDEMKKQQQKMVLTSTQANETAQHFYRKLGYQDTGSLLLEGEPTEIFFRKML